MAASIHGINVFSDVFSFTLYCSPCRWHARQHVVRTLQRSRPLRLASERDLL